MSRVHAEGRRFRQPDIVPLCRCCAYSLSLSLTPTAAACRSFAHAAARSCAPPLAVPQIEHLRALSALDSVASLLEVYEDDDAVHLILECAIASLPPPLNAVLAATRHSAMQRSAVLFFPSRVSLPPTDVPGAVFCCSPPDRRLCGGGDLYCLVRGTQLSEEQAKPLALQIVQARRPPQARNPPRTDLPAHHLCLRRRLLRRSAHSAGSCSAVCAWIDDGLLIPGSDASVASARRRRLRTVTPAASATGISRRVPSSIPHQSPSLSALLLLLCPPPSAASACLH